MVSQLKTHVLLALAVAVVCLIGSPEALAAGTPDGDNGKAAPAGLAFRFDEDAFPAPAVQAGVAGSRKLSRLSLKLYGGYSHVAAGDVNAGSDFYFELLEIYDSKGVGTVTGSYKPVHGGLDVGADLIYQVTPNIGLGLGAGMLRSSSRSVGTWSIDDDLITITVDPTLSAIPIRLGVFVTVPVSGTIDLTADAGSAYYAGLKFDMTQRVDEGPDDWAELSIASTRAGSPNIGFHGSLGLEYRLSPRMGLFVEAAGRYAKLPNFDAVTWGLRTSDGISDTADGKLYLETITSQSVTLSMFTVEDPPPPDEPGTTFREPKFDLSGFSLRAGIRIRF